MQPTDPPSTGPPTTVPAAADRRTADLGEPGGGRHRWVGDHRLAPEARRVFEDLLVYCLPAGAHWHLSADDPPRVEFTADGGEQAAAVTALLDEALNRARTSPAPRGGVLLDQPGPVPPAARPAGARAADHRVGPGLRVGGPALARWMRLADRLAERLAARLGAVEYAVPHLVGWQTLERAGYPRTFPQHLTTCAVVGPDLWALDRFAAATDPAARTAELTPAPVAISPTVCLHLFAAFADRELPGPVVATCRQACGRYEAGSDDSPTRLWSFTMREIVFVGDPAGAARFRDEALDRLVELAREVGLPARVAAAGDPFFTSERSDLATYQSRLALKHEVTGRLPDGTQVAVSSTNLHHQHFGQAFGITLPDGAVAASACVGFGLERWARWLDAYLEEDPRTWPEVLREAEPAGPGTPAPRHEEGT